MKDILLYYIRKRDFSLITYANQTLLFVTEDSARLSTETSIITIDLHNNTES